MKGKHNPAPSAEHGAPQGLSPPYRQQSKRNETIRAVKQGLATWPEGHGQSKSCVKGVGLEARKASF